MRILFWALQGLVGILLISAAAKRWGPIPPLGPFLSPFEGLWRSAEPSGKLPRQVLSMPGLAHAVEIAQDARGIPHLFAQTELDLYVAQGYVTARDRLWQMDIVTREAAGRLAEIMGPDLLPHDRMRRRHGLNAAAEAMAGAFQKSDGTRRAVQAYAQGVNAYIGNLKPRDWPLEYKMLGYAPEPWTPHKTALLIASMQWTLSAGKRDQPLSSTFGKYGPLFFRKFFPGRDVEEPPIIPAGTPWPFAPQLPAPSDSARRDSLVSPRLLGPASDSGLPAKAALPGDFHGSNNFVLGKTRTRGQTPLMANDPHLDLTLPSTWYELQLQCPGLNAYGVSLPGAPGLVLGFNDSLAWGLTNGGDDVFDWYRIQFRDSTLGEYFHDGRWVATRRRVDTLEIRGQDPVFDTVVFTHHGPVVLQEPAAGMGQNTPLLHALRWLAHDSSDQVGPLLRMQGCGTLDCFQKALVGFACPAQNFAVATVQGDIGLFHTGRLPWKWKNQGRLILDGSMPDQDWQGWVPWDRLPGAINPPRDFLFSANQEPTDSTYPYHLGHAFTNPDRAVRLGELLAQERNADIDRAFAVMKDDHGHHAQVILPSLLALLRQEGKSAALDTLIHALRHWDYRYRSLAIAPTFFETWWAALYRSVWADDFADDDQGYEWPNFKVTRKLMREDSASEWFDDVRTPKAETLPDLVNTSFQIAFAELQAKLGPRPSSWTWSRHRPVVIRHLLRLPAFSRDSLITGGCPDCVDAQRSSHGPSWRMAVSLSRPPEAYGIYPGGQSGNPGSAHYDDFVADWAGGKRYRLNRLARLPGLGDSAYVRLTLEPR